MTCQAPHQLEPTCRERPPCSPPWSAQVPLGIPPPPSRRVTFVEPVPFDFVPSTSKAAPQPRPLIPVASTAKARTQTRTRHADPTGKEPIPKTAPLVLPLTRLGAPKPTCDVSVTNSVSDLMHNQHRLSVLQWNPGPARKRKPATMSFTSLVSSALTLMATTLPSCSTKTRSSQALPLSPTPSHPRAKTHGALRHLLCVACYDALLLRTPPTVTFCSVHIHNRVPKQLDAATSLLYRFHAHILRRSVDFIWWRLQHERHLHSW